MTTRKTRSSWNAYLETPKSRKSAALRLVENRRISDEYYLLTLENRLGTFEPGQFVMLSATRGLDPYLKRPISVMADDDRGLHLLVKTAGRGTRILGEQVPGVTLEVTGPLGNRFPRPSDGDNNVVLAGGGVGIPPLLFLAQRLRDDGFSGSITAAIGARHSAGLLMLDRFETLCDTVIIATEDGSSGTRGFVTEPLAPVIEGLHPGDTLMYSCGPTPMMKAVAALAAKADISLFVSLEEFMACGTGACMGCAVEIRDRGYLRVCYDGPIFRACDVAGFPGYEV